MKLRFLALLLVTASTLAQTPEPPIALALQSYPGENDSQFPEVEQENNPPTWESTPTPTFTEGEAGSYELSADVADNEGDSLVFAEETGCTLPTGVSLDTTNDQIDATSGTTEGVTDDCVLSVDDGTNPPVDSPPFSVSVVTQDVFAFPSAEGYGKHATGGRGATDIYYITNLNNSGSGSFRDCIDGSRSADSKRYCLFAISGLINLTSDIRALDLNQGNLTIAGQSAPGPVALNDDVYIGTPNTIVRHLRFRNGDSSDTNGSALLIGFSRHANNIIVDHVSVLWHRDETFNVLGGESGILGKDQCEDMYAAGVDCPQDITIQWSIFAEGLGAFDSGSPAKNWLSYGTNRVSYINNLAASSVRRMPYHYQGCVEGINNIIYNWASSGESASNFAAYWDELHLSWIGNNYVYGPDTSTAGIQGSNMQIGTYNDGTNYLATSSWFLQGNRHPSKRANDGLPEVNILKTCGNCATTSHLVTEIPSDTVAECVGPAGEPMIAKNASTITTAEQAWTDVVVNEGAGASMPSFDAHDQRILDDVAAGTNEIIDTISDVGGFGTYSSDTWTLATYDTDEDGVSNDCEDANGTDDLDDTDGPAVSANGYTNLENFLNYKAGDTIPGGYNAC